MIDMMEDITPAHIPIAADTLKVGKPHCPINESYTVHLQISHLKINNLPG